MLLLLYFGLFVSVFETYRVLLSSIKIIQFLLIPILILEYGTKD